MSKDKWTMFKNYMHNELGVGKDDIRDWIKEAIHEEAIKMINNSFEDFSLDRRIDRSLIEILDKKFDWNTKYKDKLVEQLTKEMMKNVHVNIFTDKENS